MAFCTNCGKELSENDIFCPSCGTKQQNNIDLQSQNFNPQPQAVDNGGIGWGLLGCCIPIVGLILFLVWMDEKPRTARAAGLGALISVCIGVIYSIIVICIGAASVAMY